MLIVIDDPYEILLKGANQTKSIVIDGCTFTNDFSLQDEAEALIFHIPTLCKLPTTKKKGQLWIGWSMESEVWYPFLTSTQRDKFDLTMSYNFDSDIPCAYVRAYSKKVFESLGATPNVKTDLCSCFISNTTKSFRIDFIEELSSYLNIHFYGKFKRNRFVCNDNGIKTKAELLKAYKFELAFENSVAKDYVTEKLYLPLSTFTVPIYFGAPNVEKFLPGLNSIVDVRKFASPKDLAEYINYLDQSEVDYQKHHAWRQSPLKADYLALIEKTKTTNWIRLVSLLRLRTVVSPLKSAGKDCVSDNNLVDERSS